eukprot:282116-Hanusia_phi.AAC.1
MKYTSKIDHVREVSKSSVALPCPCPCPCPSLLLLLHLLLLLPLLLAAHAPSAAPSAAPAPATSHGLRFPSLYPIRTLSRCSRSSSFFAPRSSKSSPA